MFVMDTNSGILILCFMHNSQFLPLWNLTKNMLYMFINQIHHLFDCSCVLEETSELSLLILDSMIQELYM